MPDHQVKSYLSLGSDDRIAVQRFLERPFSSSCPLELPYEMHSLHAEAKRRVNLVQPRPSIRETEDSEKPALQDLKPATAVRSAAYFQLSDRQSSDDQLIATQNHQSHESDASITKSSVVSRSNVISIITEDEESDHPIQSACDGIITKISSTSDAVAKIIPASASSSVNLASREEDSDPPF